MSSEEVDTLTLATLSRAVKSHAANRSITDEDFLNAFLAPYVCATHVKNRFGGEYVLDKARTSKLLSGREDVPRALRNELNRVGLLDAVATGFSNFVTDYVSPYEHRRLTDSVAALVPDDDPVKRELLARNDDLSVLLAFSLIEAIRAPNTPQDSRVIWRRGTAALTLVSGDLLKFGFGNRSKQKNLIVIPVDTRFETHVTSRVEGAEHPLVAPDSIHGKWLTRMAVSGTGARRISTRIKSNLRRRGILPNVDGTYPLGSVAEFETQHAVFCLLAISSFDKENRAHSSPSEIREALLELLSYYDRRGQGRRMYVPLIGTGLSRAGLTIRDSYDLLRETLTQRSAMIVGKAYIVARPEDMQELEIGERR